MTTAMSERPAHEGLTRRQRLAKRTLDLLVSAVGLILTGWIILVAALLAGVDTRRGGFFVQERIGLHGRRFRLLKIRTMRDRDSGQGMTTVTTSADPRVTAFGRILRKTKIDELPQLINVFVGDMSLVGPRPDVPGFVDQLEGGDRIVL